MRSSSRKYEQLHEQKHGRKRVGGTNNNDVRAWRERLVSEEKQMTEAHASPASCEHETKNASWRHGTKHSLIYIFVGGSPSFLLSSDLSRKLDLGHELFGGVEQKTRLRSRAVRGGSEQKTRPRSPTVFLGLSRKLDLGHEWWWGVQGGLRGSAPRPNRVARGVDPP